MADVVDPIATLVVILGCGTEDGGPPLVVVSFCNALVIAFMWS